MMLMLSSMDAWSRVRNFWTRGQGLPAAQGGRASRLSLVSLRTEVSCSSSYLSRGGPHLANNGGGSLAAYLPCPPRSS
jgi:hypothetical protein